MPARPRRRTQRAAALDPLRKLGVSPVPIQLAEHSRLSPRMIQWPEMNASLKDPVQTRPAEACGRIGS
jgi:hypothetical protein